MYMHTLTDWTRWWLLGFPDCQLCPFCFRSGPRQWHSGKDCEAKSRVLWVDLICNVPFGLIQRKNIPFCNLTDTIFFINKIPNGLEQIHLTTCETCTNLISWGRGGRGSQKFYGEVDKAQDLPSKTLSLCND